MAKNTVAPKHRFRILSLNIWGIPHTPFCMRRIDELCRIIRTGGRPDDELCDHCRRRFYDQLPESYRAEYDRQRREKEAKFDRDHPRDCGAQERPWASNSNWDVICLQEAWFWQHREQLICAGLDAGYAFHHYFQHGTGFPLWPGQGGTGILILSKHPIVDVEYRKFAVNGKPYRFDHMDGVAGKGVGLVRVLKPGVQRPVDVYVSHLISNYTEAAYSTDDYRAHRIAQAYEVGRFIRSTVRGDLAVLCGDLNSLPTTLPVRLVKQLAGLDDAFDVMSRARGDEYSFHGYTYGHEANPFTSLAKSQRMDYVMYLSRPRETQSDRGGRNDNANGGGGDDDDDRTEQERASRYSQWHVNRFRVENLYVRDEQGRVVSVTHDAQTGVWSEDDERAFGGVEEDYDIPPIYSPYARGIEQPQCPSCGGADGFDHKRGDDRRSSTSTSESDSNLEARMRSKRLRGGRSRSARARQAKRNGHAVGGGGDDDDIDDNDDDTSKSSSGPRKFKMAISDHLGVSAEFVLLHHRLDGERKENNLIPSASSLNLYASLTGDESGEGDVVQSDINNDDSSVLRQRHSSRQRSVTPTAGSTSGKRKPKRKQHKRSNSTNFDMHSNEEEGVDPDCRHNSFVACAEKTVSLHFANQLLEYKHHRRALLIDSETMVRWGIQEAKQRRNWHFTRGWLGLLLVFLLWYTGKATAWTSAWSSLDDDAPFADAAFAWVLSTLTYALYFVGEPWFICDLLLAWYSVHDEIRTLRETLLELAVERRRELYVNIFPDSLLSRDPATAQERLGRIRAMHRQRSLSSDRSQSNAPAAMFHSYNLDW
eukprot:TRINITY_DN66051_c10_g5_i1.p1 TRINITY_DN66051_c10_g5~~TRINITY_DN66051_c10_g5_i1.p1  ORF type:complete len:841 (+),score=421.62 TRINITY_DN66051_c10_g5_i1:64-2523(+)